MDNQTPINIVNYIIKDCLGVDDTLTLEEIKNRFTKNIPLPIKVKCALTGGDTFLLPLDDTPVVNTEEIRKQKGIEDWMRPSKILNSMDDVLNAWKQINFQKGEKVISSVNVSESDSVTSSYNIHNSSLIGNSKNIVFGYNNFNSTYLLASRGNNSCNSGIRFMESIYCSTGFEINYSNKVSNSYFINNCFDLFECMFCFNVNSKKYVIANMQYEPDDYNRIKSMVLKYIFESYGK